MRAFATSSLFLFASVLMMARTKDPSLYPLRVNIIETHWNYTGYGVNGYGHGDIAEGDSLHGFDYTFLCDAPFNATQGPSVYQARWKKEGTRLVILTVEIGNESKRRECELKTTLVNMVYSAQDGHMVTYTRPQYDKLRSTQKELLTEAYPRDANPEHYPLRFSLLEVQWQKNSTGGVNGSGRGNIRTNDSYTAVDFYGVCPGQLMATMAGTWYSARWEQEPSRLTVLAHTIGGDSTAVFTCELRTDVRPTHVYMRNRQTNVVTAVTQDDFKQWLIKQKAEKPGSGIAMPELASTAPKSKLRNADVISMVGSGLSSEIIVAKINASKCGFDTSPDGLKQLKAAHVPNGVLLEMIKHSAFNDELTAVPGEKEVDAVR